MFMKNKPTPPGCNPPRPDDRMPVAHVISGDTWEIQARLFAADGGPASPDNSHVEFVLAENQFSPPLWTGAWHTGVLPYENRVGFVRVVIPRDFTKTLRRGSYQFSLRVADRLRQMYNTQLAGHFLVEYAPTSDQHSIPYRDGTSEIFTFDESDSGCDTSKILEGKSMPEIPSQRELTHAVQEIWSALGGKQTVNGSLRNLSETVKKSWKKLGGSVSEPTREE